MPYFKQFNGLRGKLTRRGVNGATWYAAFPGCPEQAFSTGMHGQFILCYAPASVRELSAMSVGRGGGRSVGTLPPVMVLMFVVRNLENMSPDAV